MTEHNEQSDFIRWKRIRGATDERLLNIYAIPNAQIFQKGTDKAAAARIVNYMKSDGLENGVLDVNIDYPSKGYHGMKIEFKYGKGKLSNMQKIWKKRFEKAGYLVLVCYSADVAIDAVCEYFGIERE